MTELSTKQDIVSQITAILSLMIIIGSLFGKALFTGQSLKFIASFVLAVVSSCSFLLVFYSFIKPRKSFAELI